MNQSSLEGALGRPYHGYHRLIHQKCAALLHGVATSHGFSDGNKRSAWACTFVLIQRSGYWLNTLPEDRIDDVVVDAVERRLTMADLTAWFRARLVKMREDDYLNAIADDRTGGRTVRVRLDEL